MSQQSSTFAAAVCLALALGGCQTVDGANWVRGSPSADFSSAESTCEAQTANIAEEEERPQFFVHCMAALGWTPGPQSEFYTPATAPDPT